MRKLLIIISICSLIYSCQDFTPIVTSSFEEEQLVVEGYITDSLQTQRISIGLVNDIGDTSSVPINVADVSMFMTQGPNTYPFYAANGTTLLSTIPFAGMSDSTYEMSFCYQDECFNQTFVMPRKVTITDSEYYIASTQTAWNDQIWLTIDSPIEQYMRYEIYYNYSDSLYDSTWNYHPQPVYWTEQISTGSFSYHINQNHNTNHHLSGYKALKIFMYTLDDETVAYLDQMQSFMEDNFSGSQYQNPPFFYDTDVHGMIYGTTVDSVILLL